MDAQQIGIAIGTVIVVIITGVVSFITGTKKCNQETTQGTQGTQGAKDIPITFQYLSERENQYYKDFVKKESYIDDRQERDEKFKEFQGELKEIKKSQTDLTEKVNQINTSVQLTAKDIEYIKKVVDYMPRRKNDE